MIYLLEVVLVCRIPQQDLQEQKQRAINNRNSWGEKKRDLLFVSMCIYVPSLRTRTMSLSITVGIRCAIVQTVQSTNSVLRIFWMRLSVAESTEAVASSSTRILACLSNARPSDTSCLCPTLQLSPFSNTAVTVEINESNQCFFFFGTSMTAVLAIYLEYRASDLSHELCPPIVTYLEPAKTKKNETGSQHIRI